MMRCDKCVCWRKFAVFYCFFVMFVYKVKSEELQCTKKHVMHGEDFYPGLYPTKNVCQMDSEGQNLTDSDCTVWSFAEEDRGFYDCPHLQFSSAQGAVSGVEFYPYLTYPNLNISFRNIDWHYMQYRVQVGDQCKLCHRLQFNKSVTLLETLRLSFACRTDDLWVGDVSVEMMMKVRYGSSNISRYAHFVMKIPPSEKNRDSSNKSLPIKDWYILVAVDVSQKPYLLVYWPAVPDYYNVTEYKVQIEKDEPEVVKLSSCQDGYCSHKMFAGYNSRNISVSVQPVHEQCQRSCYSYSPVISVEFYLPEHFILLMILAQILIVMIIVFLIYYFCCAPPPVLPQVLLLYDATTSHHARVVRILAEYLEKVNGAHCLMAEIEVPKIKEGPLQNAFRWLHKTMDEVDTVLYVASPSSYMNIRYSEYPYVVSKALSLIQERRSCSNGKRPFHERSSRYLVAVPPYCSEKNISSSLLDVPRFSIPNDLSWLLWTLYNQQCWVPPFTWMAKAYLNYCWCPGPMSAYRQYGARLEEAIKMACAKRTLDKEAPMTPQSSRHSEFTIVNEWDDRSENLSVPSDQYPGPVNKLPLLGRRDGSVISKEDVASTKSDDRSENSSVPSNQYPGPVNKLPLLGCRDGSVISKEDVASTKSDDRSDNSSMPSDQYRGPVSKLPLLGRRDGSVRRMLPRPNVLHVPCKVHEMVL